MHAEAADGPDEERRGRSAAADLHLLPSGAGARRAGRAHAARGVRPDDRGDRAARFSRRRRRWRSGSCAPRRRSATRAFRTRCPSRDDLPERLDAVLHVIYLVFNEGYSASSGESLTRPDLSGEAIRLGRLLVELLPEPEVHGTARADAAARVAARARAPRRRASWSCWTTRTARCGTASRSPKGPALVERALASRRFGPVHAAGGDRGGARRGARRRRRPTGRRSSACTTCCCGPSRRRSSS